MALTWADAQRIGETLAEAYPDIDPVTLRLTELWKMVTELPDFADDPQKSTEARLEAILQVWIDERD